MPKILVAALASLLALTAFAAGGSRTEVQQLDVKPIVISQAAAPAAAPAPAPAAAPEAPAAKAKPGKKAAGKKQAHKKRSHKKVAKKSARARR